jgi:hypothetical protein
MPINSCFLKKLLIINSIFLLFILKIVQITLNNINNIDIHLYNFLKSF